jgi:hypothetical protein
MRVVGELVSYSYVEGAETSWRNTSGGNHAVMIHQSGDKFKKVV